ncbi:MAG TPA: ABC transporter permease [Armatimonadetes bacterium]|nr:ABC transporter permease [Armatimonadota bacterium]
MWERVKILLFIMLKDAHVYYFKPPNVMWGIGFPIVLMLVVFFLRGQGDLPALFPGIVAVAVIFGTSSMAAEVIILERLAGTFDRLLLAPVPLWALILAKAVGGALFGLATTAAVIVITLGFVPTSIYSPLLFILVLTVSALTFSLLGTLISASVKAACDAPLMSNMLRFTMIFLCGVFVPVSQMPEVVRPLAYFLPLTYAVDGLRQASLGQPDVVNAYLALLVLGGIAALLFARTQQVLRQSLP